MSALPPVLPQAVAWGLALTGAAVIAGNWALLARRYAEGRGASFVPLLGGGALAAAIALAATPGSSHWCWIPLALEGGDLGGTGGDSDSGSGTVFIDSVIYLTEQVTPLFDWFAARYPKVIGSEYLGPDVEPGSVSRAGTRHEDMMNLSFDSGSLDYVLSLDVLEHVADYSAALSEVYRSLRPGGVFLFSVPFSYDRERHVVRATHGNEGEVIHHLDLEYYGNPVDPDVNSTLASGCSRVTCSASSRPFIPGITTSVTSRSIPSVSIPRASAPSVATASR